MRGRQRKTKDGENQGGSARRRTRRRQEGSHDVELYQQQADLVASREGVAALHAEVIVFQFDFEQDRP